MPYFISFPMEQMLPALQGTNEQALLQYREAFKFGAFEGAGGEGGGGMQISS